MLNQALDKWNVSNVTNMRWMFGYTTSFNQPLNKWNVSNVTDMELGGPPTFFTLPCTRPTRSPKLKLKIQDKKGVPPDTAPGDAHVFYCVRLRVLGLRCCAAAQRCVWKTAQQV